jgi:hypothetical protein
MEAIKIQKRIKSSSLIISDLDKFKGKDVEIIIITDQETVSKNNLSKKRIKTKKVAGILEKYKDPLKRTKEEIAWGLAVKGKYSNNS